MELHYRYWLGILLAMLVGVASTEWSKVTDLGQLFSFALSFASLILAVLAIFQGLQSSASFSQISSSLIASVGQISDAADSIKSVSDDLRGQVREIPGSLAEINEKIDKTHGAVLNINNEAVVRASMEESDSKDVYGAPAGSTTIGGWLAYYLCAQSFEYGKSFDPLTLLRSHETTARYVQGFLAALRSSCVMDIDLTDNEFTVKDLGLFTAEAIYAGISNRRASFKRLNDFKATIDAHFSAPADA